MVDHTHDPSLRSWVESANQPDTDFPIQNLPFATFRKSGDTDERLGVAIGDQVLDVTQAFDVHSMQALMSMERTQRTALRCGISSLLANHPSASPGPVGQDSSCAGLQPRPRPELLSPINSVELLLPCEIRNYTDFYASIHHATNVGQMFRPDNPLLPNYKWVPVGYHGRASSVVVSGTPIRRPWGQVSDDPAGPPAFVPTRRLDYELELGAYIGPGNRLGEPIPANEASDHLVGVCLLNDWSARDIQSWEYQPLGPFLSKSFATSISPWVVTMDALEPFRAAGDPRPASDPPPLPHLTIQQPSAFAITMEVWLQTARMQTPVRLSRGNFASMYWTLAQLVAHHSSNGCPLRAGSLLGSGTVSGPQKENRGCLLEITRGGKEPLELPDGEVRRFLEDGDEVILRGWCESPGFRRIGLGECRGVVQAAHRAK